MQLTLTNKNGETLDLLNTTYFVLYKADALHGIDTDISTTESPYVDGVQIESVKALPRGIELGFKIKGDIQTAINYFTSIVKSKQLVTLEEINEDGRDITIQGIVTMPPYTRMAQACEINISIYCGQPYWQSAETIIKTLSMFLDLLYFPMEGQYFTPAGRPFGALDVSVSKDFTNDSDTSVGFKLEIVATGTVEKPRISCNSGEQVGWYMQLNITMQANDIVVINTVRGNKYITFNGGSTYNGVPIINYLVFNGADWLQLEQGDNSFNASCEIGGLRVPAEEVYFNISYKGRYE